MFVLRDRTKTPIELLEPTLRQDVERIWESVPKPAQLADRTLDSVFQLEVTSLPNYEEHEDQFVRECSQLREGLQRLVQEDFERIPSGDLPLSTKTIWEAIKTNEDLDLPAHKVMVATVRCGQIMENQCARFLAADGVQQLQDDGRRAIVPTFGQRCSELVQVFLDEYDNASSYYDSEIRSAHRKKLGVEMYSHLRETFSLQLEHIGTECMGAVEEVLAAVSKRVEEGLPADNASDAMGGPSFHACAEQVSGAARSTYQGLAADCVAQDSGWCFDSTATEFATQVQGRIETARAALSDMVLGDCKAALSRSMLEPVVALLEDVRAHTWAELRAIVSEAQERACGELEERLGELHLSGEEMDRLRSAVQGYASALVREKAVGAAEQVGSLMKQRFDAEFLRDSATGLQRRWTPTSDIPAIAQHAKEAAGQVLEELSVFALEDSVDPEVRESIRAAVHGYLHHGGGGVSLASKWAGVDEGLVMISPTKARAVCKKFAMDIDLSISQARSLQTASSQQSKMPPLWTIGAMLWLGKDELRAVIYNPFWLVFLVVIFVLGKAVYDQLDVPAKFKHGFVPGMVAVSAAVVPALLVVVNRVLEALAAASEEQRKVEGGGASGAPNAAGETTASGSGTPGRATRDEAAFTARKVSLTEGTVRQRHVAQ